MIEEYSDYYVYAHLKETDNTPFYIGRGHGNRYVTMKGRSAIHKNFCQKFGVKPVILIDSLTKEQSCFLEKYTIQMLVESGYSLAANSVSVDYEGKFLANHTLGGEDGFFEKGKNNPQYGISPQDRMDKATYDQWKRKITKRLTEQVGKNNPNYGNDTLKKKLEANPHLKSEYYPRPRSQNGKAKKIGMYTLNWELLKSFECILDCAEHVKGTLKSSSKLEGISSNIGKAARKNRPYKGFRFKFLD